MLEIALFLGQEPSVIKVTEATGKTVDYFMQRLSSSAVPASGSDEAGNSNDVTTYENISSCDLNIHELATGDVYS